MPFILQDGFTQIEEYVIMTFDNCIVIDLLNMISIHAVELVKKKGNLNRYFSVHVNQASQS